MLRPFVRSLIKRNISGIAASVLAVVSKRMRQLPTTSNSMQQGVQTDAVCNIQQRWELLANKDASVCTRLNNILELRKILP